MRDADFSLFIETFGEASYSTPVPEESFASWSDKLPPVLLTYWREEGWATYANGLLWIVNPNDYEYIKNIWLEDTPLSTFDNFHVIARSAFGNLYLCGEKTGRSVTIACTNNEILALKSKLKEKPLHDQDFSIKAFFACSRPKQYDYIDTKGKLLFERAAEKYGPLEPDEMYGFEPALVMGGNPTLKNLRRLKLDSHLHILRQLDRPSLPFSNVDFDNLVK